MSTSLCGILITARAQSKQARYIGLLWGLRAAAVLSNMLSSAARFRYNLAHALLSTTSLPSPPHLHFSLAMCHDRFKVLQNNVTLLRENMKVVREISGSFGNLFLWSLCTTYWSSFWHHLLIPSSFGDRFRTFLCQKIPTKRKTWPWDHIMIWKAILVSLSMTRDGQRGRYSLPNCVIRILLYEILEQRCTKRFPNQNRVAIQPYVCERITKYLEDCIIWFGEVSKHKT